MLQKKVQIIVFSVVIGFGLHASDNPSKSAQMEKHRNCVTPERQPVSRTLSSSIASGLHLTEQRNAARQAYREQRIQTSQLVSSKSEGFRQPFEN